MAEADEAANARGLTNSLIYGYPHSAQALQPDRQGLHQPRRIAEISFKTSRAVRQLLAASPKRQMMRSTFRMRRISSMSS